MKKVLLSAVALVLALQGAWAQTNIYTQAFNTSGLPAGWQNIDASGVGTTAGKWQRKTSAYGFSSTTSANGFYIFIGDAANNDNKPEDGQLVTSSINCSSFANVALQFDHFFYTYYGANNTNSRGSVLVSTDNTNWTEVYSVNESTANDAQQRIDISAFAAYQPTVYVKFRYTGDWDGFWAVDDVKLFIPPVLDIAVTTISTNKYVDLADHIITGVVSNEGATAINSFDLTYQDGAGTPVIQSFSGLSIQSFETYNFAFTQRVAMPTAVAHNISVTASSPNFGPDQVSANNTLEKEITALSGLPKKVALVEEFTTAQCQYCPRGTTIMNEILAANPEEVIGVALHAGFGTDAMTTTDHTTLANAYTTGAPSAMIDRVLFKGEEEVGVSTNVWETYALQQAEEVTPVGIQATTSYDPATRLLEVDANATFYGPIADNFRINAYIIEDSVTGTGSGYNQVNAYNGDNTSEWYQAGASIVGFNHRHVARYMLGGAYGTTGVITNPTTDGGSYTKDYSYTLPGTWDESQIKVVVLVQHYANSTEDRAIMNAIELDLNSTKATAVTPSVYEPYVGISEVASAVSSVSVYPNPTTDVLNIAYSVNANANISFEVQNLLGETVTSVTPALQNTGAYRTQLNTTDFANGVYFVAVKENGKTVNTQKFVVGK